MPGPSDYVYDPQGTLRKQPRVTIGGAALQSSFEPRAKSPGPQAYNPNKLLWKKRASAAGFGREKRQVGVAKEDDARSPGPGDYMIPCRTFVKPLYAER